LASAHDANWDIQRRIGAQPGLPEITVLGRSLRAKHLDGGEIPYRPGRWRRKREF